MLERSQWDQRKKVEVDRVLDLSKNLCEKYGAVRGWQFGLRFNQDEGPLEYRDPIGTSSKTTGRSLATRIYDDRTSPVELIRKPSLPPNPDPNPTHKSASFTVITTCKSRPKLL